MLLFFVLLLTDGLMQLIESLADSEFVNWLANDVFTDSVVETLAITAITTLSGLTLAACGAVLRAWLLRRDLNYQRNQALDIGTRTAAFAEQWLQTQASLVSPDELSDIKREMQEHMRRTFAMVERQHLSTLDDDLDSGIDWRKWWPGVEWVKWWRATWRPVSRFLLLYRPRSVVGWFARIVGYPWTALLAIFTAYMLVAVVTDKALHGWGERIGAFIATVIFVAVLASPVLLLRWWAVRSESKRLVTADCLGDEIAGLEAGTPV